MTRSFLALLALACASLAHAVTTNVSPSGYGGNAPPAVPREAAKAMADDSSGLRRGTLDQIDLGGGAFYVHGQRLTFDVGKVQVYDRNGKATAISALKAGSAIRFTLDPRDPSRRRVSVIYVD